MCFLAARITEEADDRTYIIFRRISYHNRISGRYIPSLGSIIGL